MTSSSHNDGMRSGGDREERFINPADFKTARLLFEITNTTTRLAFKKDFEIKLIQLLEKGMELEIPTKSCSKGHALVVKLRTEALPGGDLFFEATAKVESSEDLGYGAGRTIITLVQYDEKTWERLNSAFERRQSDIEEFFKAARGY